MRLLRVGNRPTDILLKVEIDHRPFHLDQTNAHETSRDQSIQKIKKKTFCQDQEMANLARGLRGLSMQKAYTVTV